MPAVLVGAALTSTLPLAIDAAKRGKRLRPWVYTPSRVVSAKRRDGRVGSTQTCTAMEWPVAMVDQDGLKQINDRHGHTVGDEAIRSVARALLRCKRGTDFAARLGGADRP